MSEDRLAERKMEVVWFDVDELAANPKNSRTHPRKNLELIKSSLRRFGWQKVIVVSTKGIVTAGNGTLAAAVELGLKRIPGFRSDLSPAELRAYGVVDNRAGETSEWDFVLLEDDLDFMAGAGFDLPEFGFDQGDLDFIRQETKRKKGKTDPDATPAPPKVAKTRRGELVLLGDHRLFCGDASEAGDVDKLLGKRSVGLVFTDPPYNVAVKPESGLGPHRGRGGRHWARTDRSSSKAKGRSVDGDDVSTAEYEERVRGWFATIAGRLGKGRAFYVWGGWKNVDLYPRLLREEKGLKYSQPILWVKDHPVLTRLDFMGDFELAYYGWRSGGRHYFNPKVKNARDVWAVKKVTPAKMIHLTEKPVELARRAMTYSSREGEWVLDLFAGSGSTLIAAEELSRKAAVLELDPRYCDVIIQRWEEFTGKKARRS